MADNPLHSEVIRDEPVRASAPEGIDYQAKTRLREAAFEALKKYPGPVGEVLKGFIDEYIDFGYRFDHTGLTERLVTELLNN